MRGVERHIAEERPGRVLLDECHRGVGENVRDEAAGLHGLAVVFKRRVEVVVPVPGTEAEELVEAPAVGVVRVVGSIVPFAEDAGDVAGLLEGLGQSHLILSHGLVGSGDAVNAGPQVVAAGQQARACRGTDRTGEEPIETGALARQPVQHGRVDLVVPVRVDVAPALVVREDQEHVRTACLFACEDAILATRSDAAVAFRNCLRVCMFETSRYALYIDEVGPAQVPSSAVSHVCNFILPGLSRTRKATSLASSGTGFLQIDLADHKAGLRRPDRPAAGNRGVDRLIHLRRPAAQGELVFACPLDLHGPEAVGLRCPAGCASGSRGTGPLRASRGRSAATGSPGPSRARSRSIHRIAARHPPTIPRRPGGVPARLPGARR